MMYMPCSVTRKKFFVLAPFRLSKVTLCAGNLPPRGTNEYFPRLTHEDSSKALHCTWPAHDTEDCSKHNRREREPEKVNRRDQDEVLQRGCTGIPYLSYLKIYRGRRSGFFRLVYD